MKEKTTKTILISFAVIEAVVIITSVAFAVNMVMRFWKEWKEWHKQELDPDLRSVEERMEVYYGEDFTVISTQNSGDYKDITLWTLQDSSGNECHAAHGLNFWGDFRGHYVTCDDYHVIELMQTPAVQKLLDQKEIDVSSETTIGKDSDFNGESPYYSWIVEVESYDDIPAALQLALDTVTSEDSRIPHEDGSRSEYWYSVWPTIRLRKDKIDLGTFDFSGPNDSNEYDYQAALNDAQIKWCDYYRKKHMEELLPEEALRAYPASGVYTLQYKSETLELPLSWDEKKRYYTIDEHYKPDNQYPIADNLLKLLDVCGFQIEKQEDALEYSYVVHDKDDMIYLQRNKSTNHTSLKSRRGTIKDNSSKLELNEKQLEEIFGITFEIDPVSMRGEIFCDHDASKEYPKDGFYTLKYGSETIDLRLIWDENENCFVLDENYTVHLEDNYPQVVFLINLLDFFQCYVDLEENDEYARYMIDYYGDMIYITRSKSTDHTSLENGYVSIQSDSPCLCLNEKQLQEIFGISFKIDTQNMTGEIIFAHDSENEDQ